MLHGGFGLCSLGKERNLANFKLYEPLKQSTVKIMWKVGRQKRPLSHESLGLLAQ